MDKKEIRLLKLTLTNFMGFRSYIFEPGGANIEIRGDNRTGKTTLYSAFSWLLFGKDAAGNSKFSIQTFDQLGSIIPDLDHTVEGVLQINGQEIILKRVLKDIWERKNGTSRLARQTTKYFIDDIPVKEKEYVAKIANIIDEELFRLLTSVTHFNSLQWQIKRRTLFNLCEGLNEAVIDEAEKKRKFFNNRRTEINNRLGEIRILIKDKTDGIASIDLPDKKVVEAEIKDIISQIKSIKTDTVIDKLTKEKAEASTRLSQLNLELTKIRNKKQAELSQKLVKMQHDYGQKKASARQIEEDILKTEKLVPEIEQKLSVTRQDFNSIYESQMPENNFECPCCGQPLPAKQIKSAVQKFNQQKANDLAGIKAKQKELQDRYVANGQKINDFQQQFAILSEEMTKYQEEIKTLEAEIEDISKMETPEFKTLLLSIQEVESNIESLTNQIEAANNVSEAQKIPTLEEKRAALDQKLFEIELIAKTKGQIKKLEDEERILNGELETLKGQLFQAEHEIENTARMVEETVNKKFNLVKFQLFETLRNEGIKPTCITLVNGAPYGHGSSDSEGINAGLDIIKTLSNFYKTKVPVFIDRAESVTKLIMLDCQTIKLVVDTNYPIIQQLL
jgi:DNA repair exonuclease SbcCD ATPase subunit